MNMDKTTPGTTPETAPQATPVPATAPAPATAPVPAPGFGPAPTAPLIPAQAAGYPMYVAPTVPKELRVGAGLRFGAYLLNILLMIVTLGIGWLIWAMVTWSTDAANPGQKLLGLTLVKKDTGARLTWGDMFVRNFLLGGLVMGFLSGITLTIIVWVDLFKVLGSEKQSLVDSMAGSVVVRRAA
ncbi:RDD family protein [Streptomyces sp. NPDC093970]|uniref:RDD family protein n=1 Tax=Streptomyces sp. NPDC093970 TaxID=3155076 RepID=UPI00342FD58C